MLFLLPLEATKDCKFPGFNQADKVQMLGEEQSPDGSTSKALGPKVKLFIEKSLPGVKSREAKTWSNFAYKVHTSAREACESFDVYSQGPKECATASTSGMTAVTERIQDCFLKFKKAFSAVYGVLSATPQLVK